LNRSKNFIPIFYTRGLNSPFTEGHIQIVRMIAKSLMLHGVKSIFYNFQYGENNSQIEDEPIENYRIQQRIHGISREALFSNKFNGIYAYSLFVETIKTPKFLLYEHYLRQKNCVVNIVNSFRYPRMFFKKILKSPLVLHFYFPHSHEQYLLAPFASVADLIIASSQGIAKYLNKQGVAKKKIAIVYPPIDTQLYTPLNKSVIRTKFGLPKKAKIILYMGNLKRARFPEDEILGLMETLVKDLSEVLLLIIAPKSDLNVERANEIRKKTENLSLTKKVKTYVKNLEEIEKANIYSSSDVFFFPKGGSRIAVEPPLTALEAMASGGSVFAPKDSSMSEIITNEKNGFLFETKDFSALSDSLIRFLNDKNLLLKISRNARRTILDKASLATVGRKLIKLQEDLL
jgi:glycosyltransferase involved in cell wall biosynthesis